MSIAKKPVKSISKAVAPAPKAKRKKRDNEAPLSETVIKNKLTEGTEAELLAELRQFAIDDPKRVISRNWYRINGSYTESVWNRYFGTFHEFKRQAGLVLTRQQHAHEKKIARHASVDHYRDLNVERANWGERYLRDTAGRFKTILACSDLHDEEIDPFYRRVLIDTAARAQPNIISLVGDICDLPEFGKYGVDPREWDVVKKIRYMHDMILRPLREAAPEAQIDFIEGNHEARLLRHMADATPALRAVLSDLHGMTISKLLGLDQFQINYIAKADLAAYSDRDLQDELRNNYRIYYDAFLCHHFPDARNMMMPGVNGHNHKHLAWSSFNPVYGSIEWHQMGSGHRRDASYCAGEKWNMGFALAHIDTWTRSVNIEYVPITEIAVVGGKFYAREGAECISPRLVTPQPFRIAA